MKTSDTKIATCLNENMIKKISSGGDTVVGRKHGKLEQEFSPHYLAICMATFITYYNNASLRSALQFKHQKLKN